MINILSKINNQDRIKSVNEEYLIDILISNMNTRKKWYSENKRSVKSSHPLCSIIRSMGITKDTTDEQIKRKIKKGIKNSESHGFTSAINVRSYCSNVFFNGKQIVLVVAGDRNDTPIRVLYHEGKDLSLPVMDNLYVQGEPPVVIVSIAPIAISYRDQLNEERLPIKSFVYMSLLVDMVESYSEISLFNIITTSGDVLYSSDRDHPFYLINESYFVEKVRNDYIRRFNGKRISTEKIISSIPFIKKEYKDTFNTKNIPSIYQTTWIKILVELSILNRILDIQSEPLKLNRHLISSTKTLLRIITRSRSMPEGHLTWYEILVHKLENYK